MGFLILLLTRMTLLYIPYIRGYYSWTGDNFTHLGIIKDIFITGHISSGDYYPVTHLFITELKYVSGLPLELIVNHSTALLSMFYVVGIYLLATTVFSSKEACLLSMASIGCVLFNGYDVYLMPNGWSLFYLPTIFYFYFNSFSEKNAIQYKLLFVVGLIFTPFFHPLSSLLIIMMLLIITISKFLTNSYNYSFRPSFLLNLPFNAVLLELFSFLFWTLSFQIFYPNIKGLYNAITTGNSPNAIADMGDTLDKINIHGIEFIKLFLKIMGDEVVFLLLFLICIMILLISGKMREANNKLVMLVNITIFIGVIYIAYLFNLVPGLENVGSERLLSYLVIFTPITAGFVYEHLFHIKKNVVYVICILIIMTSSLISIFSLYPSPYILNPNSEITQQDVYGVKWYGIYKNPEIENVDLISPKYRLADGVFGVNLSKALISQQSPAVPDHFNYSLYDNLGESYSNSKYVMITMFDTVVYDTVWKVVGRFNVNDFDNLNYDSSVSKIYSNGETYICYIKPTLGR